MANRYWVGGTASWDGTAGTKWAATSGGAGGASVPTTSDAVFFDANSGVSTITIATGNTGAQSITCTGFTGTLTGTAALTLGGSITLVTGMTYSHTGTITFSNTATITTASKTFSAVTVDGVGITVNLGDDLNISTRTLTVTNGTFDSLNKNITAARLSSSNSNTRTISLGTSTVTLSDATTGISFSTTTATGLTFNAGTSQINLSGSLGGIDGGGKTFYNVSITGTGSGLRTIRGANTFNNLTLTAPALPGASWIEFSANQVINGTLTAAGATALRRCGLKSTASGTARTITAGSISANDCDFDSITLAGAASPVTPTRAGDCGGNSGIVFPAAKTVYRVGTNTTWSGSSSWATVSGGAGADSNFPLPQDTAVIDNNTALTGTLSAEAYNASAVDFSSRTTGITFSYAAQCYWHGSHTLSSAVTVAGGSIQFFSGTRSIDVTSAGKTFPTQIRCLGSGTFRLLDAFTCSSTLLVGNGTFSANNYNVTIASFFATSGYPSSRTINMGSGLWTLTGTGTSMWSVDATLVTLNKDTANILCSDTTTAARTFSGGGKSYNKLTIGGTTGISTFTITDGNSFTELASTKTVAHTLVFSSNQGTIGIWSITGTAGNVVTVNSNTVGTRRTFTLSAQTTGIDYLNVTDIGELSANKFYVGTNSVNGGNNSNVYFSAPPVGGATGNMLMFFS